VTSCQMCGQKTYMECQLCKKHVCFKSGKGMSSVFCCINFHDDSWYGLDLMARVELFGVQTTKFKKATMAKVKKNKIHSRKLLKKYHKDVGDKD
jgi:hypothetical protein